MSLLPYHEGEIVVVFGERVVILGLRGKMIKFRRLLDGVEGICPIDWVDDYSSRDNAA